MPAPGPPPPAPACPPLAKRPPRHHGSRRARISCRSNGPMTIADGDREWLRQTFNRAADSYHRARPDYPGGLFDDLITVTGLAPGDCLLEIGCATGKATVPLARLGFRITCVELGPDLAAVARR